MPDQRLERTRQFFAPRVNPVSRRVEPCVLPTDSATVYVGAIVIHKGKHWEVREVAADGRSVTAVELVELITEFETQRTGDEPI